MNASFSLPLMLFAAACLCLFPALAIGAEGGTAFLQANIVFDLVADRARMIQVSVVIVALGCAMMWWYK